VGQITLRIRKPKMYSRLVGICWTGTFEKKKPKKIFLARENMLDMYF
jgi:hypothetical protein